MDLSRRSPRQRFEHSQFRNLLTRTVGMIVDYDYDRAYLKIKDLKLMLMFLGGKRCENFEGIKFKSKICK